MIMPIEIFFIGCLIVGLPRDVKSSELIDDALAAVIPHSMNVTDRQRQLIKAADNDDYVAIDTVGLVNVYAGYLIEKHLVTSVDGYIVSIFRMIGSPKSPPAEGKPVVYIQHGFLGSSDNWVLIGADYDLAFLLADDGYDVWLGNIRGNSYGKSHNNLTTEDKEFWDYSFDELATLDLPAAIDYVLKQSGQKDLAYIGHSMGTTMSYIILSEMPEYNKKLRLGISLAPIAFWNQQNLNLAIRVVCFFTDITRVLLNFLRIYELLPQGSAAITKGLCSGGSFGQFICIFVYSVIFGRDPEDLNWDLMPYVGYYNPAGISTKTLYHYEQNINAGILQKYDYGQSENVKIYGTKDPPLYNLSKITTPFAFIYGDTDALAKKKNVEYLAGMLSNVVTVESVPYDCFNHLDFTFATDGKRLVYNRIIQLVSMYSNNSTNETTPAT